MDDLIKFPHVPGKCRECGTDRYTNYELFCIVGQDGRCYTCFDTARYGRPLYEVPPEIAVSMLKDHDA